MPALAVGDEQEDCAALNRPRAAFPSPGLRCVTQAGCDVIAT
jgi:hypothetical protein